MSDTWIYDDERTTQNPEKFKGIEWVLSNQGMRKGIRHVHLPEPANHVSVENECHLCHKKVPEEILAILDILRA